MGDFLKGASKLRDTLSGIARSKETIKTALRDAETNAGRDCESSIAQAQKAFDAAKKSAAAPGSTYWNNEEMIKKYLDRLTRYENMIPDYAKVLRTLGTVPRIADFGELNDRYMPRLAELSRKMNDDFLRGGLMRLLPKILVHAPLLLKAAGDKMASLCGGLPDDAGEAMGIAESVRAFLAAAQKENENYLNRELDTLNRVFTAKKNLAEQGKKDKIENAQRKTVAALKREDERLIDPKVVQSLEDFNGCLESFFGEFGILESNFAAYRSPASYPAELMAGWFRFKLPPISQEQENWLAKKMRFAYRKDGSARYIPIPLCFSAGSPLRAVIEHDETTAEAVMGGVRSIVLKILKFMPMFSYEITYIDPKGRGKNLANLQSLADLSSAPALLRICRSGEDVDSRMKELVNIVDAITRRLNGVSSVYKYNAGKNAADTTPFQIVIMNDFPGGFGSGGSLEKLKTLMSKSDECGISLIFVTNDSKSVPSDKVDFLRVSAKGGGASVSVGSKEYAFQFETPPQNCESFVEKVKGAYDKGLEIENRFGRLFDLSRPIPYKNAADKIVIPFAVDPRGKIVDLELGGSDSAHAVLSGDTGSGKSTTLHWLICSIMLHYHPDDVQLWLADYLNVEFAFYAENPPPHVKFVGLDKSPDFTYSLLDMVQAEFERRLNLFVESGVSDIAAYRFKKGELSMPRIAVVIDEFHQLAQAVEMEMDDKYKKMLENQIREMRKAGISYVLSDQRVSSGLPGLTQTARDMLHVRIAMRQRQSPSELEATLEMARSLYTDEMKHKIDTMEPGDTIMRRMAGGQVSADRYKAVYITTKANEYQKAYGVPKDKCPEKGELLEVSRYVAERARKEGYRPGKPLVIRKKVRVNPDRRLMNESVAENGIDLSRSIALHAGTPLSFAPCFYFLLEKGHDHNILVVSEDDDIRRSALFRAISAFVSSGWSAYVFAAETDGLYINCANDLRSAAGLHVATDMGEICSRLGDIRGKMKGGDRLLVAWLGMEIIAREFSRRPERKERDDAPAERGCSSILDGLTKIEEETYAKGYIGRPADEEFQRDRGGAADTLYDAREDIAEMLYSGPINGIHTLMTFPVTRLLKHESMRFIETDYFKHRIVSGKNTDEYNALDYLNARQFTQELDDDSAVYFDGGRVTVFKPYLV